jgi:hypothetical protein
VPDRRPVHRPDDSHAEVLSVGLDAQARQDQQEQRYNRPRQPARKADPAGYGALRHAGMEKDSCSEQQKEHRRVWGHRHLARGKGGQQRKSSNPSHNGDKANAGRQDG